MLFVNGISGGMSTNTLYMHTYIFTFYKAFQCSRKEIITLFITNNHATLIEGELIVKYPLNHCIHITISALLVKGYKSIR